VGAINMWGKQLIIDMTAGDKERVRSSQHISHFVETLVETIALFAIGAALQTLAMKRQDLAVTYLLVVGLESILAFAFGVLLFSESCTPARIAGVALIAGGIISLRSAY
jgi:multidrug transporter EmrE-like cation transporter